MTNLRFFSKIRDYLKRKLREVFKEEVSFNSEFLAETKVLPNTCNVSFLDSHLEGKYVLC